MLFVLACAALAFFLGVLVGKARPPIVTNTLDAGVKTLAAWPKAVGRKDTGTFLRFAKTPIEQAAAHRIRRLGHAPLPGYRVLVGGGRFQFLDHCPDWGCLAVEYSETGDVAHAYPLRPRELERAWTTAVAASDITVERAPGFAFDKHVDVNWTARYPNGDLLVAMASEFLFPHALGVVRVDRDGRPLWTRVAGHHVGEIQAVEGGDVTMWPGLLIADGGLSLSVASTAVDLSCPRAYVDTIDFISARGELVKRFDLWAALRHSPYVSALPYSTTVNTLHRDPCDITHMNSVRRLSERAGGSWGIAPGDLVVSLRNMSALAILDGASGEVKRLVRGSFAHQHSALHVDRASFLLFDNNGGHARGASRVLLVDLAQGRETTLFPTERLPAHLTALHTQKIGHISLSPDRKHAIATFGNEGVAVEIRLADAEVVRVFHSLHDISRLDQFPEERRRLAATFKLYGVDFLDND